MSVKKNYNRIKVVLAEKNTSNRQLANELNYSETTVSKWCTNDAQPNLETIFKIAFYLKIEAKDLIAKNSNI